MEDAKPFPIRIIKRVVFRDCTGTTTRVYEEGDIIEATSFNTSYNANYYVHSYGGIYDDEAMELVGPVIPSNTRLRIIREWS